MPFSSRPFAGNPAGGSPIGQLAARSDHAGHSAGWKTTYRDRPLFAIAIPGFDLRWFTPVCEVDLVRASQHLPPPTFVLKRNEPADVLALPGRSGEGYHGSGRFAGDWTLPSRPPQQTDVHLEACICARYGAPGDTSAARDVWCGLWRLKWQRCVLTLRPAEADRFAAIVTVEPTKTATLVTSVLRFLSLPRASTRDPVTGSAHSTLIPIGAVQLGRDNTVCLVDLAAGGELFCALNGDRVEIAGHATLPPPRFYLGGAVVCKPAQDRIFLCRHSVLCL